MGCSSSREGTVPTVEVSPPASQSESPGMTQTLSAAGSASASTTAPVGKAITSPVLAGEDSMTVGEPMTTAKTEPGGPADKAPPKKKDSSSVEAYLSAASSTLKRELGEAPMWACSLATVPELGKVQMHEDMMESGHLEDVRLYKSEDRRCCFLSQTWMAFEHPDPKGVKYALLCEVLEGVQSGRLDFQVNFEEELFSGYSKLSNASAKEALKNGHAWFDYWSIPQRDHDVVQQYIDSIPEFVQMSTLFIVLVPPAPHVDTGELVDARRWAGRGWCRLESIANILSPNPAPYLKVESATCRRISSSRDWLLNPVGEGAFTCCRLNHVLPSGQQISCDKDRVVGVMERLLDSKIKAAKDAGDLFNYRLVLSLWDHMLSGLPAAAKRHGATMEEWLKKLKFSSELDAGDSGWTPLRYACYGGRLDIAEQLIKAGADVEAPLSKDFGKQVYFHNKNMTILQGVTMMRDSPDVVNFLIDKKADMERAWDGGFNAPFASALGSTPKNLAALFDAGCSTSATDQFGSNLLHIISAHGNPEMLRVCREKRPAMFQEMDEHAGFGVGYLSAGIMLDYGDAETQRVLLDLGAELDCKTTPTHPLVKVLVGASQLKCYLNSKPTEADVWAANIKDMTPVLWASFTGNVPALNLLLERKADLTAKNDYGRTALVLAAMRGHRTTCDILLAAGVPKETKDCWGRDAAAWADAIGDATLAMRIRAGPDFAI